MRILAYTYSADYHCLDCAYKAFGVESSYLDLDENGIPMDQQDDENNFVHPVFSGDEWMELDEDYLLENPIQYLECSDCYKILDTYKDISLFVEGYGNRIK